MFIVTGNKCCLHFIRNFGPEQITTANINLWWNTICWEICLVCQAKDHTISNEICSTTHTHTQTYSSRDVWPVPQCNVTHHGTGHKMQIDVLSGKLYSFTRFVQCNAVSDISSSFILKITLFLLFSSIFFFFFTRRRSHFFVGQHGGFVTHERVYTWGTVCSGQPLKQRCWMIGNESWSGRNFVWSEVCRRTSLKLNLTHIFAGKDEFKSTIFTASTRMPQHRRCTKRMLSMCVQRVYLFLYFIAQFLLSFFFSSFCCVCIRPGIFAREYFYDSRVFNGAFETE